jgi:hypothetical protein
MVHVLAELLQSQQQASTQHVMRVKINNSSTPVRSLLTVTSAMELEWNTAACSNSML